MYNYVMEKLYDKIKDDEKFIELNQKGNNILSDISSFEEMFYTFDHELFSKLKGIRDEISTYIIDKIKELKLDDMMIPTLIQNNDPKYLDLEECKKELYKLNESMIQSRLHLINRLCFYKQKEETREWLKWAKEYCSIMESYPEEKWKDLCLFYLENYIKIKINIISYNLAENRDNEYLAICIPELIKIRDRMIELVDDDKKDIIYRSGIDAMRFVFHNLRAFYNDINTAKQLDLVNMTDLFDTTFQYQTMSYSVADIYSECAEIYFFSRRINEFLYTLKHLYKYINFATKDMKLFIRALNNYDSVDYYPMGIILRRLIKLEPYLSEYGLKLDNISEKDKMFLIQETFDYSKFGAPEGIAVIKSEMVYTDNVTNTIIDLINDIKSFSDKDTIKRVINGSKENIFKVLELSEENKENNDNKEQSNNEKLD